jgi:hypothetical protein
MVNLLFKLALNLIPLAGYLFFDWDAFELIVCYVIHSFAIFFLFTVNRFYIKKETRYPFFFASILMPIVVSVYAGFTYLYAWLAYRRCFELPEEFKKKENDLLMEKLMDMYPYWIFILIVVVEAVLMYGTRAVQKSNIRFSDTYMLWRMIVLHLFMAISVIIVGLMDTDGFGFLFYLIGFKIVIDLWFEHWFVRRLMRISK